MAKEQRNEKREYNPNDFKRLTLEGVRLVFRNFSAAPEKYNDHPNPNFGIILDERDINVGAIEADDWYVRRMNPKEDDPEQYRQPWIKVNIKMDGKNPPTVVLIKNGRQHRMNAKTLGQLDWTRIQYADAVIRSYRYDPAKPMSAWLVDLRVIAADSDVSSLDAKYADIPYTDEDGDLPFDD